MLQATCIIVIAFVKYSISSLKKKSYKFYVLIYKFISYFGCLPMIINDSFPNVLPLYNVGCHFYSLQ